MRDLNVDILEELLDNDLKSRLGVALVDLLQVLVGVQDCEDVLHEMLETMLVKEVDLGHGIESEEDARSHVCQG